MGKTNGSLLLRVVDAFLFRRQSEQAQFRFGLIGGAGLINLISAIDSTLNKLRFY